MRMPAVAFALAVGLLTGALFAGDSVGTALAAVAAAGAWAALALAGKSPLPGGGLALLAATAALCVWTGVSIAWSVAPDRSWAELDRGVVYLAFVAVGLLFGAAFGTRGAARALLVALAAAVVWALAGKVFPALFEDGGRAARLRDPIGYWNALALAADALLVLALSTAARARSRLERGAGTVLAYAAVVAVLLSVSRTGTAAAAAGVALWILLARARAAALVLAAAAVLPALAVAGWAFTRPALVDDGVARADRVAAGAWLGLLLVAGAVAAVLAAERLSRVGWDRPVPPALAAAVLAATIGAGALAVALGGSAPSPEQGPSRLFDASANNRLAWWEEAGEIAAAEPFTGSGAGTFEVARKRYREDAVSAVQPHSVPLQLLADTGVVGLALLLALFGAAALAVTRALRRLDGEERAAAAALAALPALWLLHALVDYPWDFLAVTGPALFAAGVLGAAGLQRSRGRSLLSAASAAALALAAAAAIATPWLADRRVREVGRALERDDPAAALEAAGAARSLDPLSLEPLYARARVEESQRDFAAALETYREAARRQPENPETWLALGLFEFDRGDRCSAYVHLNRAYTLDPAGRQWVPGGELDRARDWVNAGNC